MSSLFWSILLFALSHSVLAQPGPGAQCPCPWPSSCPVPETSVHLCAPLNSPLQFNATRFELACSTPGCLDAWIDCRVSNCSEDRRFYEEVFCGRNERGELCWNALAGGVSDGNISCSACTMGQMCSSDCNSTVEAMADRLGCCASVYFNYSIAPLQLQYPSSQVFNNCSFEARSDMCPSPYSSPSPSPSSSSPSPSYSSPSPSSSSPSPSYSSPSPSYSSPSPSSTSRTMSLTITGSSPMPTSTPSSSSSSKTCILNGMLLLLALCIGIAQLV